MMVGISKVAIATFAGILLLVVNNVAAVDYVVGDMQGWTNGFDYREWAKDKVFQVGDRLVFQYSQGLHNVYKVDGKSFKNCEVPLQSEPLTSGNDVIELKTPGNKWYICGVDDHCSLSDQKLAINVMPNYWWWSPSSPPSSAPPLPSPWFPWPMPMTPPSSSPSNGGYSNSKNDEKSPWSPWPIPTMPPSPSYGGYSNPKNDELSPWFPWPMPPSSSPSYGGYSSPKNDELSPWFPWPMSPSPDSSTPPFWMPEIPIFNAPTPSPYFSTGDQLSTNKHTKNNVEAPWRPPTLPFPWMFPPTPAAFAPSPMVELTTWWPFPAATPSPSPSYAMDAYSSDANGVTRKIPQTLMISVGIVLAIAGLV